MSVKLANLLAEARGSTKVKTTISVNRGEARSRKATQTKTKVKVNCRPSLLFLCPSPKHRKRKTLSSLRDM